MQTMDSFGAWLIAELEKRELSQSDLSRLSGLSRGTISNIISGARGRGPRSLRAIAKALRISPGLVFQEAGELPPDADRDAEIDTIVEEVSDLDETDKAEVLEFVRLLADLRRKRKR